MLCFLGRGVEDQKSMAYAAKVRWIAIGLKATVLFRRNLVLELFHGHRLPVLGQYLKPFSIYEVGGKVGFQTFLHALDNEIDKLSLLL